MSNKYFVWKDPNCNGVNPEWIQMTSKLFKAFISEPENAKRKFIRIPIDPDVRSKGCYVLETTPDGYRKWDADRRREYRSADVLDFPRRRYKDKELPSYCDDTSYEEPKDEDMSVVDAEVGNHRRKNKPEIMCLVSMEDCADPEEELTLHDVIADISVDIAADVEKKMMIEKLYAAIDTLSPDEKHVLNILFFDNHEHLSERRIAEKNNIDPATLRYRRKIICKKIRDFFTQN